MRIALIHATPVAMEPIRQAFAENWVEAELVNLLDDSLSPDLKEAGSETDEIKRRIADLAKYAVLVGSDAILYSCSAFGRSIELVAESLDLPVLKPNQAMFEQAMDSGERIGMLATFGPSVPSMEREFKEMAAERGVKVQLESILVEEAMVALRSGDVARHNRLVAEAAPGLKHCDAVILAHFSTSRALEQVSGMIARPILTSPHSAVAKLKSLIGKKG